jgi:hypothetical protein
MTCIFMCTREDCIYNDGEKCCKELIELTCAGQCCSWDLEEVVE